MSFLGQLILKRAYWSAKKAEQLPWHESEPPKMLERLINQRIKKGNALDIGCGAGWYSAYIAKKGYKVTAIDFIEDAIKMARLKAIEEGVDIKIEKVDFLKYKSKNRFDLILDSGCLHCMMGKERQLYKKSLLQNLADDGDFVLIHFEKKHFLDWRPIGPRRLYKYQILDLFAPELIVQDYFNEIFNTSILVGPKAQVGSYWFRKS